MGLIIITFILWTIGVTLLCFFINVVSLFIDYTI